MNVVTKTLYTDESKIVVKLITSVACGGSAAVHVPKYIPITSSIGTIHCSNCLSVNFTLCADLTRYVNDTRHVFINKAVYVMQKPLIEDGMEKI